MSASDSVSNLPSGVVTLLLTDIEGSTKRWGAHSELMREAVARHDGILVQTACKHQGYDLRKKGEGDSHFIVFKKAVNAVNAAIEMQRLLSAEDWGDLGQMRVRMAIHTAEAELRNEDYFGPGVNRCARMRGAAHGGQIILSSATKALVGEQLADGTKLVELGLHFFKDLALPDRIYQVVAAGVPEVNTTLSSLSAARHNLPVQLSSFVGREQQIAAIKKLLSSRRFIALLGPGGTGKTRLAVQVAADLYENYPDGVWFVPLAGLQDPSLIGQAIAGALPIGFADKDPLNAVIEEYKGGRALFVIDNCEHLDRSIAEVLNQILRSCAELHILATSREPLNIAGETDFYVPPMACDLKSAPATVDSVKKLEAVQLFVERAKSRLPEGEILTDATAQDIANIVEKLSGIPLAIEQAAAAMPHMAPKEILDKITRHFSHLKLDEVGVEERHKTIQAAIDWSFTRLSEKEKALFLRLSVFLNGWNRDTAEFVCHSESLSRDEISGLLEMLVNRSLVVSERLEGWRINRYRMLEPIREYAEAKRTVEDDPQLFEKRFEWFFNLCEQAYQVGLDADGGRYDKWLSADHENIRASLGWGLNNARPNNECLMLGIWMHRYWMRHELIREGLMWMQRCMDASPNLDAALRAESLNILGVLAWQGGDLIGGRIAVQASHEIYMSLGDQLGIAKTSANLGGIAFSSQDFQIAAKAYGESAEIFRSLGDQQRLASALENQGVSECWLDGQIPTALQHITEASKICRQSENKPALCQCLYSLLGVHAMHGDLMNQMDLFLEGSDLAREFDDPFTYANYLDLCIRICMALNQANMAGQCIGAMELAVEQAQIRVIQKQLDSRDAVIQTVREALGYQAYQRLVREGRAIGPSAMLGFVRQLVAGEE